MLEYLTSMDMSCSYIIKIQWDSMPRDGIRAACPEYEVGRANTGHVKGLVGHEDVKIRSQTLVFSLLKGLVKCRFGVLPDEGKTRNAHCIPS